VHSAAAAGQKPVRPSVGGGNYPDQTMPSQPGRFIVPNVRHIPETTRRSAREMLPPTVSDLDGLGLIAPPSDPHRYFSGSERLAAQWLEGNGLIGLRSVKRSVGDQQKTPDATFGTGENVSTLEIKSPTTTTEDGVHRQVRAGRKQSRILVLDFRRSVIELPTAKAGLRRAIRDYGRDVDQIILVLSAASPIGWTP
jgi:hypothetical protein